MRPATNQFGSALITVGVEDSDYIWTAVSTVPTVESSRQYVTLRAAEKMEVFRLTSAEYSATPPRLRIERAGADLKISWPHPANGWVLERAPNVAGRARTTFQLTVNPVNDAPPDFCGA